jgi:hypothetical protein
MIKNCLIHTKAFTQLEFQVVILKALSRCTNFRYYPVEENVFGETDLENLMVLIKKPSIMRDFCSQLFIQLLRFIAKSFLKSPDVPKWQLIERQIVILTIRLSFFDNRGLLLRYCLLRHF